MYLFSDCELTQGSHVELTFRMPAEITLTDAMRVRCTGKVLRVQRAVEGGKYGVAVCFESYTYLTEPAEADRISWLHRRDETSDERGTASPR
jgi:hypothetical protein